VESRVFHNLQHRGCDIRHRTATLSCSSLLLVVETEDQICRRFKAELAAIAALDHRYYMDASPTVAERADYAARQVQLESTRSRFYSKLGSLRAPATPSGRLSEPETLAGLDSKRMWGRI
jgi:hypothetical protein